MEIIKKPEWHTMSGKNNQYFFEVQPIDFLFKKTLALFIGFNIINDGQNQVRRMKLFGFTNDLSKFNTHQSYKDMLYSKICPEIGFKECINKEDAEKIINDIKLNEENKFDDESFNLLDFDI